MEDVIAAVPMVRPPVTVDCRSCGAECSAALIRSAGPNRHNRGRWFFECVSSRCESYGVIQHKSQPVPMGS